MTKRFLLVLAPIIAILASAAVLIPGSPVYLPDLLYPKRAYYQGHSAGYWIKALDNPDAKAKREAIFALGAVGDEVAVPTLAALLHDPDRVMRIEASLALIKMNRAAAPAVDELAQALSDEEPLVRLNAAVVLSRLGKLAKPAVPALIEALANEKNTTNCRTFPFTIQEASALALGRASTGSADGVPALMTALKAAKTLDMRIAVVRALGEVGAEASPAVSMLRPLLKDKIPDLRETAQHALSHIEGETPPAS
jgi:HEAT repeat protein